MDSRGLPDRMPERLIKLPLNIFRCNITIVAGKTVVFLEVKIHQPFFPSCAVRPVAVFTSI
jgi:hypothetical protein